MTEPGAGSIEARDETAARVVELHTVARKAPGPPGRTWSPPWPLCANRLDLNPTEQACSLGSGCYRSRRFSKVKGLIGKARTRTCEAPIEALGLALDVVTDRDACGFFRHCGYRITAQLL